MSPLARTGLSELRKIGAFVRRDWLVMLSYRAALITDWLGLLTQVVLFSFVSQMVPSEAVPVYGGAQPSYLEFVAIGILVNAFLGVGLTSLVGAVRAEQMQGTLEHLLTTPLRLGTFQIGAGLFELLYVPVRMLVFLGLIDLLLPASFAYGSLAPTLAVLALFLPSVWGIGLAAAGTVLTVRKGAGVAGFAGMLLGAASGAYFPIDLLPGWLQAAMRFNPVTIALEASRATLLGGAGWEALGGPALLLVPTGLITVAAGALVFRVALRRELRKGTLNLY
jgi:ABC-2 type transport system permease protein